MHGNGECNDCLLYTSKYSILVTVHTPLFLEVFLQKYAKVPRHTSQNPVSYTHLLCSSSNRVVNEMNSNSCAGHQSSKCKKFVLVFTHFRPPLSSITSD